MKIYNTEYTIKKEDVCSNIITESEKEIILQAMDLIIEDTEYTLNYGVEGLRKYRNNKLKTAKEIKTKLQDIFKYI